MTISRAGVKNSSRLCVFFKLIADQSLVDQLDCRLKSRYFSGGERRSTGKGKFLAQINPWRVVDFFPRHIPWMNNRLFESPWYVANIISTILVRLIGYSIWKCNMEKRAILHAEQLHAHNWSFFEFLIQKIIILFFYHLQLLQSRAPLLGFAKSIY